jgi:hypothetical protein
MINPKAKQLKNSKLNKDGAWQSMSRNDSLKSVERKPVTLDEQQDCWQTCIAMILQNIHIQGFPLMTTDGKPFKIGGIHLHSKVYELFSACRDILRINNRKSDYCDSLDYLLAIGKDYAMPHKAEKHGIERVMRASAFREQMNLVRNSFAMDKSRQRNANRKNAIAFMRSVANLTSRVKGRNLLHISIWEFCFGLQSLFYIDFNGVMKILILHDPCKQLNILLAM